MAQSTYLQKNEDGGRIITFESDVTVTHGALTATSDRARYLERSRRAVMEGHVVMWQDSTIVRGPYAYYERNTGVARFPNGVVVEKSSGTAVADQGVWRRDERIMELRGNAAAADTTGTLDAQAMTYNLDEELFWAIGDARLVDDVTGVIVEGQNLRYDRAAAEAVVTGAPTAVLTDDDGVDIHVASERMTYNPQRNEAVAEGDVRIRRDTMEATAGRALFFRNEDRAVLTESPEMVDGATVIRGERIEMSSPGPGRRVVRVTGAASVANRFLENRPRPMPIDPALSEGDAPEPLRMGDADTTAAPGEGEAPGDSSVPVAPSVPAAPPDVVLKKARPEVRAKVERVRNAPAPAAPEAGAPVDSVLTAGGELAAGGGESLAAAVDSALAAPLPSALAAAAAAADSAALAAADSAAAPADSAAGDSAAVEVPEWLRTSSDQLPTENLLFGDHITMTFVDNELEHVVVVGHGRSKFFPNEAGGILSEWNDVVGDTLDLWFTESELDSVDVRGNGQGEYRFPSDLAGAGAGELRAAGKLVDYESPSIRYIRGQETMHLDGGATVRYKTMVLTSGTIDFEAAKEIMTASGNPPPVLVDKEDTIHGSAMNYHLPSGKGEIVTGRTQFEAGYYRGKDIWKLGDDELGVDQAEFTTCDLDDPHYHFSCRHMKIYLDDKMVARPVVLKIRHIPVFALPFYMTSLRKDRHSGFLLPNLELGVDDARGRFIRNMGYYWAPNDYLDVTGTVDFYPARDQFIGYLNTRYNVRYRYSGSVNLKYNRDATSNTRSNAVEIRHDQTISETARLTANASFLSANSFYQDIDDSNRLDRDLSSHVSFTKRFEGSRNLRVEARRNENLDNGSFTETLPSIAFTQPSQPITGRAGPTLPGEPAREPSWLDDIYYKVDFNGENRRRRDTVGNEVRNVGSTVKGNLNSTQTVLRPLRISQNLSGETTWIDEDALGRKNPLRATYNGSLTASTDIYGTFLKSIGPVRGFRHVIRPNVSWNWAPDFRQYFYTDSTGVERDRFTAFGSISGTQRKTNRMNFSVANLIQTKVARGERESRYDLFNFNSSISYDLLAEDEGRKPLTNLRTSLNVLSAAPVNQSWSVSHDPYTWNLLSSSVTTAARLSSRSFGGADGADSRSGLPDPALDPLDPGLENPVGGGRPGPSGSSRYTAGSWDARLSHVATHTPPTGSTSSSVILSGQWSPTSRWQVRADYQYDLTNKVNTTQSFSVNRIIHCWELSFDRRLLGGDWQYYLRINVMDLPDIQLERGDRTSGRGFGTSTLPF